MDKAVVCFKARHDAALQESQAEEQPLGGHNNADFMSGHRAAEQERRILLQAFPPTGAIDMGATWTRQGDNRSD